MPGKGETLWTVQSVYNTKKTSKYDGLYWSLEEANQEGKVILWTHDARGEDETDVICDQPDKPYEATNTSDCGAQVRVSVVKVDTFMLDRFSTHELKPALEARSLPSKGTKAILVKTLADYLRKVSPAQPVMPAMPAMPKPQVVYNPVVAAPGPPQSYESDDGTMDLLAMINQGGMGGQRANNPSEKEEEGLGEGEEWVDTDKLWGVMSMLSRSRAKPKWEFLSWSMEDCNERAECLLLTYPGRDFTTVMCDKPDKPYSASTCFDYGSNSVNISVEEITPRDVEDLKLPEMKKVLRQKHMSDKGNKGELAARLKAYLAGAAPKPDNHLKHGHVRPLTMEPDPKRVKSVFDGW